MTIAFIVGILAFAFIAGFALGSLVVFYRVKLPPLFETEPEPSPEEHPGMELLRLRADNAKLKEDVDFYISLYTDTMQTRGKQWSQ